MSLPDIHDDLVAIAEHGSRTVRPRPVEQIISRGRQRRRRRTAAGTLGVVLAVTAGSAAAYGTLRRPAAPPPSLLAPAASPAPDPGLTGKVLVALRLTDKAGTRIARGYDDDDRIVAEYEPGKDYEARIYWWLRPDGEDYRIVGATRGYDSELCMGVDTDRSVRIRPCDPAGTRQRFTITPDAGGRTYTLAHGGSAVRVDKIGGLQADGRGPALTFTVEAG